MLAGRLSAPNFVAESVSNTWPRRFMLSRPIQVPSGVRQIQLSPCFPPVELIIRCSASAGGLARSATGVCARAAAARKVRRKNGANGMSDMRGKAARVVESASGDERTNEENGMSGMEGETRRVE